ncbi:purine-nucleoside phosphorylase [Cloacibacillus sp. An23]|uniref:purine-nucleoside phosphorylase n=1 Tax=Cloacibacillus sp. An23 TaxID=1965591 RepID=UPI000B36EBDD|nr:purine-nucleoside phosphorylase [Cloacibacillus sp. An23]OUO91896.1 purine-nucleoside phosphorylase [Cloacibacillus sp. An23]
MYYWDKVNEALKFIEKKSSVRPEAAVILGSGLGSIAERVDEAEVIPYGEIPYWPHSTAPGHAGRLVLGRLGGKRVAVMQGRVHYYEGYNMQEVTFPTRVLGCLGVRALVATNASGGINADFTPGTIAAIEDHINFMGVNPLAGVNNDEWGVRFPDMSEAYDKKFISVLERAASEENITLKKGVYIAFSGPSFETPAEVRMARILGADMVGMSTVPEVLTANHMGIRVLGISCAANYAAGITSDKLTQEDVLDIMVKCSGGVARLVERFLSEAEL